MDKLEICIIAAVASNGAIGRGNSLLWHIPSDMRFFKRMTMGCPVIMGRRTFESVGRQLPGRLNIVVSHGSPELPDGVRCVHCLGDAFELASKHSSRAFVIGGAQIYAQSLPYADRLFITRIYAEPSDADAFFPDVDSGQWNLESVEGPVKDEASSLELCFETYVRRG